MDKILIPQMEPLFGAEETNAVSEYLKSGGWITEFKKTEELERLLCEFTGAKYCSMVTNGTISLTVSMLALGMKPGDEVIIPNQTMIASPNSAVMIGVKPVLVDIEPKTLCLDLKKAQKAITKNTKAIMYVPLNGRSGDMKEVVEFCKKNNLFLIEDSAQALGCFQNRKHLGTFGDVGSLSFSVPKIITTGQGGALLTNSETLYKKIRSIKDFGRARGGIDIHDEMGWNFKFTDLQAVIGIEQMKKLEIRIKHKKEIYKRYVKNLKNVKEVELIKSDTDYLPWFIDIYVPNPDSLSFYLKEVGIGTRKVYPAINTQKIYREEYKDKSFPVSEDYANRGLWLPSSSKLSIKQVDLICEVIANYYENTRKVRTALQENYLH